MPLVTGTRLGPYEILSPLGAGGMGEVYRARDSRLGRDVAIKIVPPSVADNAVALGRFEREARASPHCRIPTSSRSTTSATAALRQAQGKLLRQAQGKA